MYQNTNKECVKELGRENYKAHPGRNRMAILSVILTTILISVAFTVGITMYLTIYTMLSASPGPGSDGIGFYGSYEDAVKAKELPQADWVAYAKRCSAMMLQNKEFVGMEIRLFAPDTEHYGKNMVSLLSGSYPEQPEEILVSDTFARRFGISGENTDFSLKVMIEEGGESVEKEMSFRICGIYRNPLSNISNIYDEIYTAESFVDTYNPELPEGRDSIYVRLNNLNFWQFGNDVGDKIQEVNDAVGGNGTFYRMSDASVIYLIPVVLLVLVIMLCGYFFIYNVFFISIVNDIRFYGELKTIGMTSGQLRGMLFGQMQRICIWGISIGCLIGYLAGRLAAKVLVPMFMENIAGYYQPAGVLQVFIITIVFSWLTVYISTMKPFRLAGSISPIEAARYRGKGKKGIFTVVSFLLGGLLFLGVYTVTIGYNIENMVERYNQQDFHIMHKASIWAQDEPFKAFPKELVKQIEKLPGVTDKKLVYKARTKPDFTEYQNMILYNVSQGEITKEGELAQDIELYNAYQEEGSQGIAEENERGNYVLEIMGITAEGLKKEEEYCKVLEGEINEQAFASGEYLIYQRKAYSTGITLKHGWENAEGQVHAGDKVHVSFYDDIGDRYVDKTFTIMAIIENDDMFGTGNFMYNNLIIQDKVFRDIYTNYENLLAALEFNMKEGMEKEQYEKVQQLVENYGNLQLRFESKYETYQSQVNNKNMLGVIGTFLSVLVGMIGISNMVNTVATDVLARKIEFAAMQSIGMTKKQMTNMIFLQSIRYAYLSVLLSVVLGIPMISIMADSPIFSGFSLPAFMQAVGILLVITTFLCGLLSHILTRQLNQLPVAERLREIV